MDKKRVLLLGSGQCGNRLVDLMLKKDRRYTGLYSNANLKDMENLDTFDINRNVFYIPNATGTGKSRELADQYLKEEAQKLADMILKYALQDVIMMFMSADGGWGSGSMKSSVRAIKRTCPNKSINIVAVFPNLTEGEVAFKNTIGFWNDLVSLKSQNLIDSIQIIDNNKRKTLDEINESAVEELDYILGFEADTIDENDSKRINTAKGYKVLLKLDDKFRSADVAIDNAIKKSVFAQPSNYDCNYLGVSVKKDSFYADDFKSKFDVLEVPYCGYNENENLLLLSGCQMPKEAIEVIQLALKDVEKRKKERQSIEEDLIIDTTDEIKTTNNAKKESKTEVKSTISSKDLNNLFNDNFWDD